MTGRAAAQDEPASPPAEDRDVARAREAYEAGLTAIDEARWDEAETAFLEAYQLTGVSSALLNVAIAQRALAHYVAAEASLAELLARDDLDDALRTRALELRREVLARVGTLRLRGLTDDARLYVDGEEREAPTGALTLRVDPGGHAVSAEADGHAPFRWTGEVAAGQEVSVAVTLEALPPPPAPVAPPSEPSVFESPWLWITVALVALAAGGVVAGVLGYDAAQPQPSRCPADAVCLEASL